MKPERLAKLWLRYHERAKEYPWHGLKAGGDENDALTLPEFIDLLDAAADRDRLAKRVGWMELILRRARDTWPRWPLTVSQRDIDAALEPPSPAQDASET